MKFRKKFISLVILSSLMVSTGVTLVSPINNVYASEIQEGREIVTPLENTFSFKNIHNTYTTIYDRATYFITNNNQLRGIGKTVYGAEVTSSMDVWVDILKDDGTPITDVVQVASNYSNLYVLDAYGDVYYSNGNKLSKVNGLANITKMSVSDHMGSEGALFLTKDGEVYGYSARSGLKRLATDIVATDIECNIQKDNSYNVTRFGYAIGNDGNMYYLADGYSAIEEENVSRVENYKYYYKANNSSAYNETLNQITIDNAFNLNYETYDSDGITKLNPKVYDITNAENGDAVYVITDLGIFKPKYYTGNYRRYIDKFVLDTSIPFDLVSIKQGSILNSNYGTLTSSKIALSSDGKVYASLVGSGDELGNRYTLNSGWTEITEPWMNTTNIIPDNEVYDFEIVPNSVNQRESTFDINFKLATNQQPVSFDIYFAQSKESTQRANWKEIEKGVKYEDLSPVQVDTGFTNFDGSPIMATQYKYTWNLPNRNLVDITIIVEPKY